MPPTLRRRPQCHYCGKRLNTAKRKGDKIHCDNCLADNFFDESDEVVDAPQSEVNRLASQRPQPEVESDSDIFCKKCLTNQAFYVQALSDYLPDEDDPRYPRLLEGLPEFERNLELRYPQCCDQCEPRVAAQIQEANYMAKSDHLRRVLHRTHDRRRDAKLRLRSLFISVAGTAYFISLVVQLLWHALASQANSERILSGITPAQCLRQWPVPSQCTQYFASLLPYSLLVSLLCIWWNPQWQYRLAGREGRLVGLNRYYQIQALILAVRFASWAVMQDVPFAQEHRNALHTVLLLVQSSSSLYAVTQVVKIDTTPLVDWHQVQAPLVSPNQFRPPTQSVLSPPSSQDSGINLANFASPANAELKPWRPPTPPTEEMDWVSENHNFNPQPRVPKPRFQQQTPFYGTLPAKPTRGPLNPKAPPPPEPKKAIGIHPGWFGINKSQDNDQNILVPQENTTVSFKPARFFADKQEADTGLENIFDKLFHVQDSSDTTNTASKSRSTNIFGQPNPSADVRRRSPTTPRVRKDQTGQPLLRKVLSFSIIVVLGIVISSLCTLEFAYPDSTTGPSRVVPYVGVIPILHLFEEALYTKWIAVESLALPTVEVVVAVAAHMFLPEDGSKAVPLWNKMVIGVIGAYLLMEIYRFCSLQSPSSNRRTSTDPMTVQQSQQRNNTVQHDMPHQQPEVSQFSSRYGQQRQEPPQNIPLTPVSQNSLTRNYFGTVRKRDSDESISSVSSINTTSTAPGWKTPQHTGRAFDWQSDDRDTLRSRRKNSSVSTSLGGLGGLNLNDFGTGASIAGPRMRQTPGRQRY